MNLTNILVYNGHNGHTTGSLTLANIFIMGVYSTERGKLKGAGRFVRYCRACRVCPLCYG